MPKRELPRVLEPDTGIVHFEGAPGWGFWSLCGGTDRIGFPDVVPTDAPCTCAFCRAIARYCQGGAKVEFRGAEPQADCKPQVWHQADGTFEERGQ